MFRGQFTHSVDAKGRISLPVRFRDQLMGASDPRIVLTPAIFDACLHLYPMHAWEEFEAKVNALPSLDRHAVRFRRLYVSAAVECELDGAGRVLVPQELRAHASSTRTRSGRAWGRCSSSGRNPSGIARSR